MFREMIVHNLTKWAKESTIESTELVRSIFALLLRQYRGIHEVCVFINMVTATTV